MCQTRISGCLHQGVELQDVDQAPFESLITKSAHHCPPSPHQILTPPNALLLPGQQGRKQGKYYLGINRVSLHLTICFRYAIINATIFKAEMAHPKRDYITLSDQNNEPIFVRIMDSI